IMGWEKVLLEMTRDFKVYYVETREKASSVVKGNAKYSVEEIGKDIVSLISCLGLEPQKYILFGSSLGATAILDSCRFIKKDPLCLVLIGPNAIFRFPKWSYPIIWFFPPRLYLLIKPLIRWYLKTFEVDLKSDSAQYEKYSGILDVADPWKLKKIAFSLARYSVWDRLDDVQYPTLIIGASKDIMHIPENLLKMVEWMGNVTYIDMETNSLTHSEGMVREMRKYISTQQNR
ncbi:MAG: alpha/beta hydrolase, partial [Deltaproteobacteria bacterium]|nr:alpha/beta hydrolase [Deltaproteobacteria bacterium]